jgi:hypothetical protein
MPGDDTFPPPRVARQARVARRVDFKHANAVAHAEACFGIRFGTGVTRPLADGRQVGNCEWWGCLWGTGRRLAGIALLLCHETMFHQQSRGPRQPLLVIADAQVIGWGNLLDGVTASPCLRFFEPLCL